MKNKPNQREISATLQILDRIRKIGQAASTDRRRFADYRYLKAVYRGYHELRRQKLLEAFPKVVRRNLAIRKRARWHPLRIIIEATNSGVDLRVRSRWTRALEFALRSETQSQELTSFFRSNGGVAGCARLAAKAAPKRKTARDDWATDDDEVS